MYDLDPALFTRRGEGYPIRTPRFGRRALLDELRVSGQCLGRVIRDTDDHPAIFELLHHFPLGDLIRLIHPRLPLLRDPHFLALYEARSLPALDTAAARALLTLPEGSLGRCYAQFVAARQLDDTFLDYVPLPTEPVAYLAYRTVLLHDLIHFLLGYEPGVPVQEAQVEAFLLAQTGAFNHFLFLTGFALNFLRTSPGQLLRLPGAVAEAFNWGRAAQPLLLTPWQSLLERQLAEVRETLGLDRRPPCSTHSPRR